MMCAQQIKQYADQMQKCKHVIIVMNRKNKAHSCAPHLHGQGHGPLKFTWKWGINLSHLSMLTPSSSADLNHNAISMHVNDKVHLRQSVVTQTNVTW